MRKWVNMTRGTEVFIRWVKLDLTDFKCANCTEKVNDSFSELFIVQSRTFMLIPKGLDKYVINRYLTLIAPAINLHSSLNWRENNLKFMLVRPILHAIQSKVLKVADLDSRATNRKCTQPGCTKMAIFKLLLGVATSNLVGRTSECYFIIKFSLSLFIGIRWREIRSDAGKQLKNEFVASFL